KVPRICPKRDKTKKVAKKKKGAATMDNGSPNCAVSKGGLGTGMLSSTAYDQPDPYKCVPMCGSARFSSSERSISSAICRRRLRIFDLDPGFRRTRAIWRVEFL